MARCPLRIRSLLVCLALSAASPPDALSASPEVMTFDTARARAEFEVHVMWLFPVHGRFGTLQGGHIPPLASMFDDVYKEMPAHLREQLRQAAG